MINLRKISTFFISLSILSCAAHPTSPNYITVSIEGLKVTAPIKKDKSFSADFDQPAFQLHFDGQIESEFNTHVVAINFEKKTAHDSHSVSTVVRIIDMNEPMVIGGIQSTMEMEGKEGVIFKKKKRTSVSIMLSE